MIGTKKYTISKALTGILCGAALGATFNYCSNADYLDRKKSSEGFRRSGNYTVVNYNYLEKQKNQKSLGNIFLFAIAGGVFGAIYSTKEKEDVEAHKEDIEILINKNKRIEKRFSNKLNSIEDRISRGGYNLK